MSSTVGMSIENRADMNTLNAVGNEWGRNNENGIAVSKEKLEVLQKSFNLAKSTIKKNRTVSIFTHNMKDKAVWANFKQVFKNIGRNIGVLARTIATFGENKTIALKAERELAENLGTMKQMMNCLDEGNFKNSFNLLNRCHNNCHHTFKRKRKI